jgi:hypothetical protein
MSEFPRLDELSPSDRQRVLDTQTVTRHLQSVKTGATATQAAEVFIQPEFDFDGPDAA